MRPVARVRSRWMICFLTYAHRTARGYLIGTAEANPFHNGAMAMTKALLHDQIVDARTKAVRMSATYVPLLLKAFVASGGTHYISYIFNWI